MDEEREQPKSEPATALNAADENSAVSEIGSQEIDLGKFKNTKALLDAYNNLQAEFTKKSQQLSQLKQDKINEEKIEQKSENLSENDENFAKKDENNAENGKTIEDLDKNLSLFLEENGDAEKYGDEIKSHILNKNQNPFERAWASVILSHIKGGDDKVNDPIINQYILNDEKVKNKIIESYLDELSSSKPPVMMSSQSGERLSDIRPDSPKTLEEAKIIVGKMFS